MTHANTKDEVKSLSNDQRMKVYEDKEKAFYEFLEECECGKDETGADKLEDKPLTGLQCLLALTEILDRAAKLRVSNYDLEQRIEILQRFKLIAEVQNELHNATLDLNSNSLIKHKKGKHSDEPEGHIKRSYSAENLETLTQSHAPKLESSFEEFNKTRSTAGKSFKISGTWGKVKDKWTHKDPATNTHSASKSKRHRSTDTGGALRLSFNLDTPSPTHSSSATTFTQREINISPTTTDDGDFGGVWLGGDTSESSTTLSTATVTSHAQSTDYGGVWLGPPTIVHLHRDENFTNTSLESNSQCLDRPKQFQEKIERQLSEPVSLNDEAVTIRLEPNQDNSSGKMAAPLLSSRIRTSSYDETQKAPSTDNQSPTFMRKKSSRLLAHASSLLQGSDQIKRVRRSENLNELPKEFRKKMEQWQVKKEVAHNQEAAKANKQKALRFKSKKKGGFLKQRSKSAERVEGQSSSSGFSDEFEEKLREWSLKQGFHPTYYIDVRRQISSESVGDVPLRRRSNRHYLNKSESLELTKSQVNNYLTVNTQVSSSCTESTASLSPAVTLDSFYSAENLNTLREISQSDEHVFYRDKKSSTKAARKLSRSEEALNVSSVSRAVMSSLENSSYTTTSNVDLYARASDHSLEKHLSLCHITSESSINLLSASSNEQLSQPSISTRSSNISGDVQVNDEELHSHEVSVKESGSDRLQSSSNSDELQIDVASCDERGSPLLKIDAKSHNLQSCDNRDTRHTPHNKDSSNHGGTVAGDENVIQQKASDTEKTVDSKSKRQASEFPIDEANNEFANDNAISNFPLKISETVDIIVAAAERTDNKLTRQQETSSQSSVTHNNVNIAHNENALQTSKTDCLPPQSGNIDVSLLNNSNKPTNTAQTEKEHSSVDKATVTSKNNDNYTIESSISAHVGIRKLSSEIAKDRTYTASKSLTNTSAVNEDDNLPKPTNKTNTTVRLQNTSVDKINNTTSTSANGGLLKENQQEKAIDYDINSNVTNKTEKSSGQELGSVPPVSPFYVGTEVPLKLRLKSLAMEYELEDSKRKSQPIGQTTSTRNTHKRTRSYDLFSNNYALNSTKPISSVNTGRQVVKSDTNILANGNQTNPSKTGASPGSSITYQGLGHNQHSSVQRLKSADQLIYDHSCSEKTNTQATRPIPSYSQYPKSELCTRRERFEKPKEGTVKKAMSIFRDGAAFNTQFGTDFAKSLRPQLS